MKIIVAYTQKDRVMGKDNRLPWHYPEDLRRFKQITLKQIVVMGRKTYESLPIRPLPSRVNVVLTRRFHQLGLGNIQFHRLEQLQDYCQQHADREIFLIGGADLFWQCLQANLVTDVYATEIHAAYAGDCYFPPLEGAWQEVSRECRPEFDFVHYRQTSRCDAATSESL